MAIRSMLAQVDSNVTPAEGETYLVGINAGDIIDLVGADDIGFWMRVDVPAQGTSRLDLVSEKYAVNGGTNLAQTTQIGGRPTLVFTQSPLSWLNWLAGDYPDLTFLSAGYTAVFVLSRSVFTHQPVVWGTNNYICAFWLDSTNKLKISHGSTAGSNTRTSNTAMTAGAHIVMVTYDAVAGEVYAFLDGQPMPISANAIPAVSGAMTALGINISPTPNAGLGEFEAAEFLVLKTYYGPSNIEDDPTAAAAEDATNTAMRSALFAAYSDYYSIPVT